MKVDEKLIKRIGAAMKLDFSEDDIKQFSVETEDTLAMLERLSELDTEGVKGTFYGGPKRTASFRGDKAVRDEKQVEALLDNAAETADHLIQVPAIMDDGEGGA